MIDSIKRYKFIYIVSALVFLFAAFLYNPRQTTNVQINFKNASNVKVEEFHGEHGESHSGEVGVIEVDKSGEILTLDNNATYNVVYDGMDGFEDGSVIFNTNEKKSVTINPSYSAKKLDEMLLVEQPLIQQSVKNKYPNIYLYEIQNGKLYKQGDWYGTTLKYIGEDYTSSDTLRIVMYKKDDVWQIITDPPSIYLNKYDYKNIPFDILSDVNNFQKTKMLEKFTNPDTSHGPDGQ